MTDIRLTMRNETTIVIFGATGDLAQRKLLPALFKLSCKRRLPPNLRIIGFARRVYSDESFRQLMWKGVQELGELSAELRDWDDFAANLFYVSGDLADPLGFDALAETLARFESSDRQSNRLFYLSIAPQLYDGAIRRIGESGLASPGNGWRRVVLEKPFGMDLASARKLNEEVHRVFDEQHVFRIDHYLGKETVQNLLVFRFANAIFEPLWNRNYVSSVQISVAERVDVADRAEYYNRSGVVRDMVQNHLLQLLTLVAMEPPSSIDADSLRNRKVDVLKAVRRWQADEISVNSVAGQYAGYLDERGVGLESKTPTYVALRLFIDNWRWQGVPFYLRTGKSLAAKRSELVIQFRSPPHRMFSSSAPIDANVLGICLQPDEGAHLRFEVKVPDQGTEMRSVDMEFHYASTFSESEIPEAYERLLQDALEGDASLFIRSDHIEEAWDVVDPLLSGWGLDGRPLASYEKGSWGPAAADTLLAPYGHRWLQVCAGHRAE